LLENDVESLIDADSYIKVFWQSNSTADEIKAASIKLDLLLTVKKHITFF